MWKPFKVPGQKTNKFFAQKTKCSAGHPHPSKLEAAVCEILLMRVRAGDIRNLKWQASVQLPHGIRWKVDWKFEQGPSWTEAFAEAKGFADRGYLVKLKIWRDVGPAPLELWKGNARRPILTELIKPKIVNNCIQPGPD